MSRYDPGTEELWRKIKALEKRLERLDKMEEPSVYQALIGQSSTSIPFEDRASKNTLGAGMTFARSSTGQYTLSSAAFSGVAVARVFVQATLAVDGSGTDNLTFAKTYFYSTFVYLKTYRQNATTQAFEFADDWYLSLEITIHPA